MVTTAAPAMDVRLATAADIPAIVRMGTRFATLEYQRLLAVNPKALAQLAATLIAQPHCAVWVAERAGAVVGMLAMLLTLQPMSGETIATELCWWMEPEARGPRTALRMLADGKAWARANGATRLQMIAPNEKVGGFYERLGFERVEIHYQIGLP